MADTEVVAVLLDFLDVVLGEHGRGVPHLFQDSPPPLSLSLSLSRGRCGERNGIAGLKGDVKVGREETRRGIVGADHDGNQSREHLDGTVRRNHKAARGYGEGG